MSKRNHKSIFNKTIFFILKIFLLLLISFLCAYGIANHFFRLINRSIAVQTVLLTILSLFIFTVFFGLFWGLIPLLRSPEKYFEKLQKNQNQIKKAINFGCLLLILFFLFSIFLSLQPFPYPISWKHFPIDKKYIQPTEHGSFSYSLYFVDNLPGMLDGSYTMAKLYENGSVLGPGNSPHADIGVQGQGRFSLWKDRTLYFSTTDNTDPRSNGRNYVLAMPMKVADRWKILSWAITIFTGFVFCITFIWIKRNYLKIHWKEIIADANIFIFIIFPIVIFIIYKISSAYPIIYGMTYCIYFPSIILLKKILGKNKSIIFVLLFTILIFISRIILLSEEQKLDQTDLTALSFYDVPSDAAIEQDFYLPESDFNLDRYLANDDIDLILRIVGDIHPDTKIYINNEYIGSVSDILIKESETPMYDIPHANNYFLQIPKESFIGPKVVSVKLSDNLPFVMGYSNGIAPLPTDTHVKLIHDDGVIDDIANNYAYRRFRFSMVFYLVAKADYLDGDHPILGSLH